LQPPPAGYVMGDALVAAVLAAVNGVDRLLVC
jgi:hypothetical protein